MRSGARRDDLDLEPLRTALAPYGVRIGARRIQAGDEGAFADRAAALTPASLARRRASGAARIAARALLADLGADPAAPLKRGPTGAPIWPDGIVGSLAHDEAFAVAVAAWRGRLVGLGVDVEPAEALPADLVDLVLGASERLETEGDGTARRLAFACKEAVYKAIHPLDGSALEYADIEVRLGDGEAVLRDGRRLRLATLTRERLVAAALALQPERR
jgi:4'-phosphopantetheinyl transferase EntD